MGRFGTRKIVKIVVYFLLFLFLFGTEKKVKWMIVFAFVQSLVYRVWLCPSNSKVLVSEKYEAATQVSLLLVSSLFPRKVSLVWLVKISAHLSFGYECK